MSNSSESSVNWPALRGLMRLMRYIGTGLLWVTSFALAPFVFILFWLRSLGGKYEPQIVDDLGWTSRVIDSDHPYRFVDATLDIPPLCIGVICVTIAWSYEILSWLAW